MQFVLNKLGFNFATHAAMADAYSPFAQHIDDIENKRSRLFPDRRRIPGRKMKYIFAIVYLIHVYAVTKVMQTKKIIKARNEQQIALQRKVAPYFQSVHDVEYTTLKHRYDLLAKEVLGEQFVKTPNLHNLIAWAPMNRNYYRITKAGQERYQRPMWEFSCNRFVPGYETQNI